MIKSRLKREIMVIHFTRLLANSVEGLVKHFATPSYMLWCWKEAKTSLVMVAWSHIYG